MTTTTTRPSAQHPDDPGASAVDLPTAQDSPPADGAGDRDPDLGADGRLPVSTRTVGVVAVLAMLAVGWLLAGLFAGTPAKVAVLGLSVAGALAASLTAGLRSGVVRLVAPLLPLALVLAAASREADEGVLRAVTDAVGSGQLAQPPVTFGPGWLVLVGTLLVALGAASVHLALAAASTRWAALLPLPVVVGATLLQPVGRELVGILPAVVLLLLALALAQGGELARDGAVGGGFEPRRLARAGGLIAVAVALLALLVGTTRLLPSNPEETLAPAHPPAAAGSSTEQDEVFRLVAAQPVPLRLGVLDGYDGQQWLTPPYDPAAEPELGAGTLADPPPIERALAATVTVGRPDTGRFLPLAPGTFTVEGLPADAALTPQGAGVRLPVAVERGTTYTLRYQTTSDGQLAQTRLTPATLDLPAPPAAAQALLNRAPADPVERLRFLRGSFFDVAQEGGPGGPTPVPPARVDQILRGSAATPFELAAAEALLVQWGGVASRVAYGYLQREEHPNGGYVVTPASGAAWVEVQTADGRWVPLTDRPRQEQPPSQQVTQKVLPSGQRLAELQVPLQQTVPGHLYEVVRYWVGLYAAIAAGLVALWLALPALLRGIRSWRRRRWAAERGPRAQIAVAYAGLRDKAIDLTVGHPTQTPLEFLDALIPDEDHVELAWLVDRGLFGDLQRDLTEADVAAARTLSRHLTSRMTRGQSYAERMFGFASHASLRDPWSAELPGAYPTRLLPRPRTWRGWQRWLAGGLALALLVGIPALIGLRPVPVEDARTLAALPDVPGQVQDYAFEPVPEAQDRFAELRGRALVGQTELYLLQVAGQPMGTLQTAAFKAGLADRNLQVRSQLVQSLGMTDVRRVGSEIFYTRRLGDLTVALWFSRDGQAYQLLTTDAAVEEPLGIFARLLASQSGLDPDQVADLTPSTPTDIRQWSFR